MTKWKDVQDGTKLKLVIDLYSMSEVSHDLHYQLLTKAEIDDIFTLSYLAGELFEFDSFDECLYGVGDNDGELGINIDGTIDPKLYEIIK